MNQKIEFSRPFNAGGMQQGGENLTISASEAECAELAKRFGLPGLHALAADVEISPWRSSGIKVNGAITARVSQRCIVTIEVFEQSAGDSFTALFWPREKASILKSDQEMNNLPEEDMPELYDGDTIDLGETVAEYFALVIDPYPRKQGAALPQALTGEGQEEKEPSPFRILENLKKNEK